MRKTLKRTIFGTIGALTTSMAVMPVLACTTTQGPSASGSSLGGQLIQEIMYYLGYQRTTVKYTNKMSTDAVNEMTGKDNFFYMTSGQTAPSYKETVDGVETVKNEWRNKLTRTFTVAKTGVVLAVKLPEEIVLKKETSNGEEHEASEIEIDMHALSAALDDKPDTVVNLRSIIKNVDDVKTNVNINNIIAANGSYVPPQAVHIPVQTASKDSPISKKFFSYMETKNPDVAFDKDFAVANANIEQSKTAHIDNAGEALYKLKNSNPGSMLLTTFGDLHVAYKGAFGKGSTKSNGIYPVTLVDTNGTPNDVADDIKYMPTISNFEDTEEYQDANGNRLFPLYPMILPVNMVITHNKESRNERGNDAYTWIASQIMSPQFQEHMRIQLGLGRLSHKEIVYQTGWTFEQSKGEDSRVTMDWTDKEIVDLGNELANASTSKPFLKNTLTYGLNL